MTNAGLWEMTNEEGILRRAALPPAAKNGRMTND
jgi:hypothetical protein